MGKVIAVANQKGGVGKTTTTVNLAASLAIGEKKTLVIDFDPQGNASSALGVDRSSIEATKNTVYHALIGETPLSQVIKPSEMDCLFVAPVTQDLAGAEIELVGAIARENKLKNAIAEIKDRYDYILIDCPPSLGLLTLNALNAADSFLVPLQCEYFALEGLSQLLQTVSAVRAINPSLAEEGIVLTMFDGRNNLSTEVVNEVRKHFGDKVFETVIPRNVRLSECSSFGKPILLYDIDSRGCLAYLNLAKEVLARNQPKTAPASVPQPPPFKPLRTETEQAPAEQRSEHGA